MSTHDGEVSFVGPRRGNVERRAVLAALASEGDAAAIATFVLAEGLLAPTGPATPDVAVLGRTEDLLSQCYGDEVSFLGWVAALANGVTRAEGLEEWVHQAIGEVLDDPANRPVLWSEIRRGDLVVGTVHGVARAAVALDGQWGIRLGPDGVQRVSLVELFAGSDGPRVLRDKLWFWASYGRATRPDHLRDLVGGSEQPTATALSAGPAALWLGAAAVLGLIALVLGTVLGGTGGTGGRPVEPDLRSSLFPLEELQLIESTSGNTDLRFCVDGVPGASYEGDLRGIRVRSIDVYRFDANRVLVHAIFLESLTSSMLEMPRRLVRGYAVDSNGLPIGIVQIAEATPSGDEVRGRITLDGEFVEGSEGEVAVDGGFQFYLDLAALPPAEVEEGFRVAVDSIGGTGGPDDALPCHVVVTDRITLN